MKTPSPEVPHPLQPLLPEELILQQLQEQVEELERAHQIAERQKAALERASRLRGRIRHLGAEPRA